MRKSYHSVILGALVLCMGVSHLSAAPFGPVFRLMDVRGDVAVKLPGSNAYVPAQDGKAYPYGTSVTTGAGGSALVTYSEGNTCQAGPKSQLTIDETSIFVDAGKLDIVLQSDNKLTVQTPCSSAETVGGDFAVEIKPEAELMISVYTCKEGNVSIISEMFTCPELGPKDYLSVSCALDHSFIRLKNVKGTYDISFTDDTGTPRVVKLEENGVVKIWRRKADETDAIAVTILLVAPDDTLTEAINYILQPPAATAPEQAPAPVMGDDDDDDDDQGPGLDAGDDDDDSQGQDEDDFFPIPEDITPKGLR